MSRVVQRAAFQVHLWLGLGIGLYIALLSGTGAALVFRSELQRATAPELFRDDHPAAPRADVSVVVEALRRAYPEHTLVGVDAPWSGRQTYLAYETKGTAFITVLADPSTGRILGQLPAQSFVSRLQELHESLLAGSIGRTLNGIGGVSLVVISLTGVVIWWPGRTNWRRTSWQLHRSAGIWVVAVILMWAVTGAAFEFSKSFRATVNRISPLTIAPRVTSEPPGQGAAAVTPTIESFIAQARQVAPDAQFVRVVVPSSPRAPFLVVMTHGGQTRTLDGSNVDYYYDRYTGKPLLTFDHTPRTAGDHLMASIAPLHLGTFGGLGIRVLWFLLGLSPSLLFVTGGIIWWRR